jgi:antagonist of KipI
LSFPRVLPLGDAAVTLELGDSLDEATNARVRGIDDSLARAPFEGFRECVPTLRSLLVLHEPGLPLALLTRELLSRAGRGEPPAAAGRPHEIPTVYGGEHGPDLAPLSRRLGVPERELVRLHGSRAYTVLMLGFTPGFAYLGLLPEALAVARHPTPRVRVPGGSVGLAGRQTGIYPAAFPGGWQLVGRCGLRLFDPHRPEPALLAPGDRVQFRAVDALEVDPAPRRPPSPHGAAAVEVVEAGLLTTVQDAGRRGYRRLGVAGAGAADALALADANRALGNDVGDAALECTLSGPSLLFHEPVRFAVAGADLGAQLVRAELGAWPVPHGVAVLARPGNVLRFAGRRSGFRATVALEGGIDVPEVLGSRSTDLAAGFAGFGGRALAAGDRLALSRGPRRAGEDRRRPGEPSARVTVRVVLGPQADQIEPESVRLFLSETWRVSASSDRVGCRLDGPPLRHRGPAEILSDGMVPGSIQVPPDGRPILMLCDAPTTGGYPKLATVVTRDLAAVAQLVPGQGELRFEAVRREDA